MNINNRLIALVYRIAAFILGFFAVTYDFGILNGEFKTINLFYFTIISNLFCIGLFLALIIVTVRDIFKDGINGSSTISPHIKGEIMISILLTMTVYHFILIPYALKINPYQNLKVIDIILHYCMPVLTLFDWLLFDKKKRFRWYDPFIWVIGPYLYVIFVFIQANFDIAARKAANISDYIYAFLDVKLLGDVNVLINLLSLTVTFIIVGYVIYGIDRIKLKANRNT